ncbi:hypothetical protein EDD16DRAFT_1043892 [Pisolithus croceorrhizus]|nr:hypothetical protein EDD16DRAFT_1043892 [Pisolithus croceorrhizus]
MRGSLRIRHSSTTTARCKSNNDSLSAPPASLTCNVLSISSVQLLLVRRGQGPYIVQHQLLPVAPQSVSLSQDVDEHQQHSIRFHQTPSVSLERSSIGSSANYILPALHSRRRTDSRLATLGLRRFIYIILHTAGVNFFNTSVAHTRVQP